MQKSFIAFHRYFIQSGIILVFFFLVACGSQKKDNDGSDKGENIPDGWVSLFGGESLEGWEITQFGAQGTVKVSDENLRLGMGDGCTGVTYTGDFPRMNYEVMLEAQKISGNDFFCGMTFPVDTSYCSLIVGGWGGPVVGISSIDGRDASDNETSTLKKFENNTWYNIRLKVTPGKIEAWIDGEKLVDFNTEGHKLSIRPEVYLSRPFGICSWATTAELRDIR
ncbi:MAG: 3-keto-disaccharide hydrolase, partial [Tangfeifania sp.]